MKENAVSTSSELATDSDVETFSTDGAVCLRGVIGQDWIDRLLVGVEHTMANPSPRGRLWNRDSQGRESRYDSQVWRTRPEYAEFVFESPLAEIAGQLMESARVNFFFDAMFSRMPGTKFRTPFHQDEPYWSVDDPDHTEVMTAVGLRQGDPLGTDLYPEVWARAV